MSSVDDVQHTPPREATEWKIGGRTAIFAALGYGAGPVLFLTTASVFIKPTIEATGWSTSQVLVSPMLTLLFSAFGPLVGRLVDQRGVRRTVLIGLVPFIVLLVLFATLPINSVTFYALAAGIGIFGSFGFIVPYNRAVASWFDKGAGKAFGIVGAGGAAMPLLGIPLVTLAIYGVGWQAGYVVLAAFALLIALPAAVFGVRERSHAEAEAARTPTEIAVAEDEPATRSVRELLRTVRFWVFALSVLLVSGGASAFLSNMQPILLDGGLSVPVATTVTTLFTAGVIVGRLGAGALLDLFNRYLIGVVILGISALGALTLTNVGFFPVVVVAVAALFVAFSQGAEGDFAAYFMLKEYGRRNFGTLFATVVALAGVGGLVFPYAFGFIRDLSGGYTLACVVGACAYVSGALAIVLFGLIGRRQAALTESGGPAAEAARTPA